MWRLTLAVALALVVDTRRADACSCAYEPAQIWPKDGDTGVPLNARITVRLLQTQRLSVTLEDAEGNVVPLVVPPRPPLPDAVENVYFIAAPSAPLRPNTTYRVTARDEYRPDVFATFTTGISEDQTAPSFSGLVSLQPETMTYPLNGCTNSCVVASGGHLSRIRVDFAVLPSDVVFAELRTRGEDGVVVRMPIGDRNPKELGFYGSDCESGSPVLVPGGRYCARMIAYDVAGNASGESVEICADAAICPPRSMYSSDACTPSNGCGHDEGYDPFGQVDPDQAPPGGGCASSHSVGAAALAMTVMSWIGAGRARRRRLDARDSTRRCGHEHC